MQQKLININVEGTKHKDKVFAFIDQENPTVLCMQETPRSFVSEIEKRDYHVTFVPLTLRAVSADTASEEGLLLATKDTHKAKMHQYHSVSATLQQFNKAQYRETMRKAVIMAEVGEMNIATTHFTWTADGSKPNQYQQEDIVSLMKILDTYGPHVLCGDLNILRYHNRLYEEYLSPRYRDMVPEQYTSSLDPTLHRCAHNPERAHLFTDYMVDHLLVQEPLQAHNVSLTFGISDHAAITAELTSNNSR